MGGKAGMARRNAQVRVRRAYAPSGSGEGQRFLIDRLWPRGIAKGALAIDGWLREVAPSTELRRWFGHRPERWEEFRARYHRELDEHPEAWAPLAEAARQGPVTLLYGARDEEHNNAVALRAYLERHWSS